MGCHDLSCGALRGVMFCHAMSCSPCLLRSFAVPFSHIVPSSSVPSAPPPACRAGPFIARICVRARAGVCAGAVCAPDCPRARPRAGAAEGRRCGRDIPGSVMRCHVRHAFPDALPFRFRISFLHRISFRSVPSAPPPAGGANAAIRNVRRVLRGGAGPFTARICVRARARVCAGAVRAPDCPRARPSAGRTSPVRSPGCFFEPAPARMAKQPPDGRSVPPYMAGRSSKSSQIKNYY